VREGIQKGRRDSIKRRNTNELNFKMTETPKMKNKQENVSNFNIKLFCPYCPPYNIQKAKFKPYYREKYPPI
jgi:hypothetical protein